MAKGLAIGLNYHNRISAIDDFNAMAKFASEVGFRDLALQHLPPKNAGWRTIDKHLAKLRDGLRLKGFEPPPNPSSK